VIQFLTGVIGSGKTYYAINYIVKNFAKNEEVKKKVDKKFVLKKVNKCITNINELKLDEFENVYPLKFKEFYENLKVGYQAYQDGATDTELNELKEIEEINHSLIILDECQNFLAKKDDVLVWWLSYARHMYMEVILITQNLSLVDAKYKSFSEFFYKAQPSSLRIFNNYMRYNQYSDSTLYATRKTGVIKVKIIPEIFDLYGSGDNVDNGSLIKKFILFGLGFLILMIFAIFAIKTWWVSDVTTDDKKKEFTPAPVSSPPAKKQVENKEIQPVSLEDNKDKIYIFICNFDVCLYNKKYYPVEYIFKALKISKKFNVIYSENFSFGFKRYFIKAPENFESEFLNIFSVTTAPKDKRLENENNNNFISPIKLF